MNSQEQTLESFVDQILTDKQFTGLEPEVRAELHADMVSRAEDVINAALLASLSDEDRKTFETMVEADKSGEELSAFLNTHIADANQVIAGALLRFRDTYLAS